MKRTAKRFYELFKGGSYAHGVYDLRKATKKGLKTKGKAHTAKGPPTTDLWEKHLTTKVGLGISPIEYKGRVKNKVAWAALDIDLYDISYTSIVEKIEHLPLVPIPTKSGGLHVYVFFKAWTSAAKARKVMEEVAVKLGHGGCEVFPKQTIIDPEGDSSYQGNWINMPYAEGLDTVRACVDRFNQPMTMEQFLDFAEDKKTSLKGLASSDLMSDHAKDHEHVPDGPPCLQWLTANGFPEGSMNNALVNLATYYKKVSPDGWEDMVREANQKWMGPGTHEEVQGVIRNARKKDYHYMCKQEPLCGHCDKATCSQRKHGVSVLADLPDITDFTKVQTCPPTYYMTISEQRIGPLSAEQIMSCKDVSIHIFMVTNIPLSMTGKDWLGLLGVLMANVKEVEANEDIGEYGRFLEELAAYLIGPQCTENKDELLVGRIWQNGETRWFRMDGLIKFADSKDFKYKANELASILKEEGYTSGRKRVKGTTQRVWIAEGVKPDKTLPKPKEKPDEF